MRMQLIAGVVATAVVVTGQSPRLNAGEGDAKAAAIMAETRKALGGEKRLAAMKGLSVRAEFRREMSSAVPGGGTGTFVMMRGPGGAADNGGQLAGSIEIDLVLPDKLYRMESTTSGIGLVRVDGFEGDRPFMDVSSSNPGARVMVDRPGNDPEQKAALLRRVNTELARLLLGMIGATQPGLAVTYNYAGQAESADGTAHAIDVAGSDGFNARLFIDTTTNLPLMLTFSEPEPRVVRMSATHGAPAEGTAPRS